MSDYRFTVAKTAEELRKSLDLLIWAVGFVPVAWHYELPDGRIRGIEADDRSVAQHIAHLILYEELLATPVLKELASGRNGTNAAQSGHMSWMKPQIAVLAREPIDALLARLRRARAEHVLVTDSFDDDSFNKPLTAIWNTGSGPRLESPGWVATKTVQHTGEHTNSIFRFGLFYPD